MGFLSSNFTALGNSASNVSCANYRSYNFADDIRQKTNDGDQRSSLQIVQQTVFASDAFNFGTHDSCNNFDCNFTNENFTGKNISANEFEQKGVGLDHNYVLDDGQGLSGAHIIWQGEDYGDGENASSMNHNYVLVDGQG